MKKTLLLASTILGFAATNAQASYCLNVSPYVGAEFSRIENTYGKGLDKSIEDDLNQLSLIGGLRFGEYLGVEAFIQKSEKETYRNSGHKFTNRHYSIGADLMGYYPIFQQVEVLGGVGYGQYYLRAREAGVKTHKDTGYALRFTTGAQYNLNYNWSVRATARYLDFHDSYVNHSQEFGLGVIYKF